jgi:ferredoxin
MAAMPTDLRGSRCLWQRHSAAGCKYCVEACPTGALQITQRAPDLQKSRCIGCGACLAVCPVECFETGVWSERSLVKAVALTHTAAVDIVCKNHPSPGRSRQDSPVIQVETCLAAISPGAWFEIGQSHTLRIHMEYCADCPIAKTARYAHRAVELANAWLSANRPQPAEKDAQPTPPPALTPALTLLQTPADSTPAPTQKVISAERPVMNRRDFLFGFARSSGPAGLGLTHLPVEQAQEKSLVLHQPAWLRRLAEVYPAAPAGRPAQDTAPEQTAGDNLAASPQAAEMPLWPTLAVSKDCAACGACARYCPSGALSTAWTNGQFRHHFSPGLCVACGLCAQVCSPGALTRSYAPDPQPFQQRVMAERPAQPCRKCGSPAVDSQNGLCYWCAAEPQVRSILDSVRSQLLLR